MAEKSDENAVMILAAMGVALLAAGTFFQSIVLAHAGQLVPQVFSRIVCEQTGGAYIISLPTESGVCDALSGMKSFAEIDCGIVSQAKRPSCQKLQQIVSERILECASSQLLNSTGKYSQGSQEAASACDAFSA